MPLHYRVLWRDAARHGIYTLHWDAIKSTSYVVITAAEAQLPEEPRFTMPVWKFIGDARFMQATNVAPFDGGVQWSLHWFDLVDEGAFPYLNVWTDITVFDAGDPAGQG
ncbi:MAG TPA: hypothetical protein VJQ44_18860, partial [Gemmatimonadales bacterium]|nr:hypothetical protein [Gemmatimonadales bacterium]